MSTYFRKKARMDGRSARTHTRNSSKPAVQRRTTNCVNDLGQVTLEGNAQTEEPLKVKKYSGACPVLELVPTVSWDGRPPVLGLVARQRVPALAPLTGDCAQSLTLVPSCLVSRFPVLPGKPRSHEVPGVLRRRAPALRQTLCCGVERRAQFHLTGRSIPGGRTRDLRVLVQYSNQQHARTRTDEEKSRVPVSRTPSEMKPPSLMETANETTMTKSVKPKRPSTSELSHDSGSSRASSPKSLHSTHSAKLALLSRDADTSGTPQRLDLMENRCRNSAATPLRLQVASAATAGFRDAATSLR